MKTSVDPGMITLNGVPLNFVVMTAFRIRSDNINGPSWLDTDCFEIAGKLPANATQDQLPETLKGLLAERFKLAAHKEVRSRPGYDLLVDRNGPKIKATDTNDPVATAHAGQVTFGFGPGREVIKGSMTMSTLARLLSNRLKVPIQDLTALTGKYNVDLSWVPDSTSPADDLPDAPTSDVFTAVRSSLGLNLEQRKQQVDILVIDHIERTPTEKLTQPRFPIRMSPGSPARCLRGGLLRGCSSGRRTVVVRHRIYC